MLSRTLRALFVISLATSGTVAWAQVPPGNREYAIAGSVHNEASDAPLADARVQLLDSVGNLVHPMLVTNAHGEFAFGLFRPGEYALVVEHDGYQQVRTAVDITRHDESNIVIRLRAYAGDAPPNGNSVSAHELAIPQKAREAFEKGVAKLGENADYNAAIEQFQRAVGIYPDYYEAYAEIGFANARLKNLPAAEAALRKSVALSAAKYSRPLLLLSMLLNDQNRSADAEPVTRQAVGADAKSWRAQYELARALVGLHHLPEAENSAYAARDLKPESPEVYLLLSEIHRRTHNAPALMQDFDTYLRLAPQGQAAPEVRRLREQLLVFLQTQPKSEAKP